jgi:hypothetical protein
MTSTSIPSRSESGPRTNPRRDKLATTRALARIAHRDPEHLVERLALYAGDKLADDARLWAREIRSRSPNSSAAAAADELLHRSASVARINGAIAGTPFFVALVPGYLIYLWQEARMALRTAALYGHDPRSLRRTAELLAMRGVHRTVDAAEEALMAVRDAPLPDKPGARRSLAVWTRSLKRLLVLGGFMHPDGLVRPAGGRQWLVRVARRTAWAVGFVASWIVPMAGVITMAWACEYHARQLGHRSRALYAGEARAELGLRGGRLQPRAATRRPRRRGRLAVSSIAPLALIILVAVGGQAFGTLGLFTLIGAPVLLSVTALSALAARR